MNLICPHCQKLVTVADSLGGQTTNCPQCQGPFTVPLPPRPAPAPPPAPPPAFEAPTTAYDPLAPEEPAAAPPPPPTPPPAPPSGGYRRQCALSLQPRIVRWIAPACFVLIFFLFFFPWVGVYYGSYTAARQLGVGVAFGVYDGEQGKESLAEDQRPGVGPFTLLYFLVILGSVVVAGALVVLTVAPQVLPPHLVQLAKQWRSLAVAGIALFAFLWLLFQVLFSFPLESKVLGQAEAARDASVKSAKEGERATAKIAADRTYGSIENAVQRRFYFRLVMLLNLIAVLGALADLWLEKRPGQPLPRVLAEW